jgi:hypothetical protein
MSSSSEDEKAITDLFGQIPILDRGPYQYWYAYLEEAVYCYLDKRYIASILVSSATVETILFWQYFKREHKNIKGAVRIPEMTPPLSELFDYLKESEIPLRLLMDEDEVVFFNNIRTIASKKKRKEIVNSLKYVKTRNKFSHADLFKVIALVEIEQFKKTGRDFNYPYFMASELKSIAYSQLYKTLSFVRELATLSVKTK